MLLVVTGIMGSLSFINCYAMEKNSDFVENNNFIQEEKKDIDEEKKGINEEEKKDIDEEKKDINEEEKKDIGEENKKEQCNKLLSILNESSSDKCNEFEKKYNNSNILLNELGKDDVFEELFELDLALAKKIKELKEKYKQEKSNNMAVIDIYEKIKNVKNFRNFVLQLKKKSTAKDEYLLPFYMSFGKTCDNLSKSYKRLLENFTQKEIEEFNKDITTDIDVTSYDNIDYNLLNANEGLNILNEKLSSRYGEFEEKYNNLNRDFIYFIETTLQEEKEITEEFNKIFNNFENIGEGFRLLKENCKLSSLNKSLLRRYKKIEEKYYNVNRALNGCLENIEEEDKGKLNENFENLGYNRGKNYKLIKVIRKLIKLNKILADACSELEEKYSILNEKVDEFIKASKLEEKENVNKNYALVKLNKKLTKLNEILVSICSEFEEKYNSKSSKLKELLRNTKKKNYGELDEYIEELARESKKDSLVKENERLNELNGILKNISDEFEEKYKNANRICKDLEIDYLLKENVDKEEYGEALVYEKLDNEKKLDNEIGDLIKKYKEKQFIEENEQLSRGIEYFKDLHNKLKQDNEIMRKAMVTLGMKNYDIQMYFDGYKNLIKNMQRRIEGLESEINFYAEYFNSKKYSELREKYDYLESEGERLGREFKLKIKLNNRLENYENLLNRRIGYLRQVHNIDLVNMDEKIGEKNEYFEEENKKLARENAALKEEINNMKNKKLSLKYEDEKREYKKK